jgi:uncharacterized membrane protein YjfL (UPF0719 family)
VQEVWHNGVVMGSVFSPAALANALIYAVMGLALLHLFWLGIQRFFPGGLAREVNERQNTAAALLAGLLVLAAAVVIGSTLH